MGQQSHLTISHSVSLKFSLVPSSYLRPGPHNGIIPLGFPTKILYALLFSPHTCYLSGASYPP